MIREGTIAVVSVRAIPLGKGGGPDVNGYICMYNGRRIEVYADTSFEAQQKAAKALRVSERNRYRISVWLAEKDGETVEHSTAEL